MAESIQHRSDKNEGSVRKTKKPLEYRRFEKLLRRAVNTPSLKKPRAKGNKVLPTA